MGYDTSGRATQGRQALDAAIKAIHRRGQEARDRRADIADDPVLKAPWAKEHLASAYTEAENEETGAVLADREQGYAGALAVREELEAARQWIERPGADTPAQIAGQRLQRMLDAGVPLSEVVHRAVTTDDQDGLAWLAYNVRTEAARAVAARGAPDRATSREVQRQGDRLYEAITDARLGHMGAEERAYHEHRRDLARAVERLEAHTALAVAEAKGAPTTVHRFKAGLLDDNAWADMIDAADHDPAWDEPEGAGPVPASAEPVGAA